MDKRQLHKVIDPLNKQRLIKTINILLESWNFGPDAQEMHIFSENNPGRGIKNYNPTEFEDFVISISKISPIEYLSSTIIESESVSFLSDLITRKIHKDEDILEALEALQNRLENMVGQYHVIVPIDNLALEKIDKIKIGNTRLIPFDNIEDMVKSDFFAIIDSQKSRKDKAKESDKLIFEKDIISTFKNKTCACIFMTNESNNLYQEALIEAENIVNLLRIYIPLTANSRIIKIGINEGRFSPLSFICLRQDKKEIYIPNKRTKFNVNYVITLTPHYVGNRFSSSLASRSRTFLGISIT